MIFKPNHQRPNTALPEFVQNIPIDELVAGKFADLAKIAVICRDLIGFPPCSGSLNYPSTAMKKQTILSAVLLFVSILLGMHCQSKNQSTLADTAAGKAPENGGKISYFTDNQAHSSLSPAGLYALIGSKKYTIIPEGLEEGGRCIEVFDSLDFDQDGYDDALVMEIVGCGGNNIPNAYFFCSYSKAADKFLISEVFGDTWEDPVMEDWNGKLSVKVVSSNQGHSPEMAEKTERFILENGKAVRVEYHQAQKMPAIVELLSEDYSERDKARGKVIYFDLNEDGKKEKISGDYWERWASIGWSVQLPDGKFVAGDDARKRVGVLASKTKGYHDLVLDLDHVLVWNGTKYVDKE